MLGKTALGKYKLLRSLGAGSNAEVFLAEPRNCPSTNVVIKRIHDHVVSHHKFRQLFEAEVRSMANFTHPYAVRLLDAAVDDPIGPCLVMEYVPGVTLEQLLEVERSLPPERVARLLGYFCHALQAAHDAGIIHRDLKPANLMVVDAGTDHESLKVMDFGFAGFSDKPHIQLAELTGHGPIYAIGTPAFVSPEMIRGDSVDSRSDIYSMGVILFEMLTGRLPFSFPTQEKLLTAHIKQAPPRFHKIGCSHISPAVEGVVQLALSKYPNERQQSPREVAEMFGHALGESVWEQTQPLDWVPPARPTPTNIAPSESRELPEISDDPFHVAHYFEVCMPERLVAAKLRGFVDDLGGQVLASEPGLIRMRVGVPAGHKDTPISGSGIFGWISTLRRPTVAKGHEPIQIELHMEKPDPSTPLLSVIVEYGPLRQYPPKDRELWRNRCDKLNTMLRQYLGA